jgi:hypothetical protein
MNVRQKLSLAALSIALPVLASAQAAAPAAAPAFEVKPYGFALVTYNMQNGVFAYPEYPGKISAEKTGTADNKTTNLSARQSRFGFSIANADSGVLCAKLGGKFEADFFGGVAGTDSTGGTLKATAGSWDSALLRLRYAYGMATWDLAAVGKVSLTVGQTDRLVNALHPELGAYIAVPTFMFAGNLTGRSPQIRVGYDFTVNDMIGLSAEVAALNAADKGGPITTSAGNNANMPDVEARVQAVVKPVADVKATVGVGFHTNKQTYDLGAATEDNLTATLVGVDVNIEATKYVNIRGEWFSGKGTDEANSGAFPDLKVTTAGSRELLKTSGFWVQAVVKPLPALWVMGGYGQTKADVTNDPTYSMMNFGVLAPVGKNLRFGLEYTISKSKDVAATDMSGNAIALSSRFSF